jgi:hypothetical protein
MTSEILKQFEEIVGKENMELKWKYTWFFIKKIVKYQRIY